MVDSTFSAYMHQDLCRPQQLSVHIMCFSLWKIHQYVEGRKILLPFEQEDLPLQQQTQCKTTTNLFIYDACNLDNIIDKLLSIMAHIRLRSLFLRIL